LADAAGYPDIPRSRFETFAMLQRRDWPFGSAGSTKILMHPRADSGLDLMVVLADAIMAVT